MPLVIFFLVGSIVLMSQTYAIRYPVSPNEPKTPLVEGYEKTDSSKTSKKPNQTIDQKFQKEIHIKVVLGSGDELTGFIKAPEKVRFEHYKNGLVFKKTMQVEDISSVEIKSFQKELKWKKKAQYFYEFKPFKIRILTKDKNEFFIDYLFQFLQKFKIHTSDGVTTLYSFFADEFNEEKGWSEVASNERSYHDHMPHPQSIRKIIFFTLKTDEDE